MFKTRFISMLVLLMTAVTGAWATITVTWDNDDITGTGMVFDGSFTKDGVTITAGMIDFNEKNFMMDGTFTTTLGNFTKIEVTAYNFPNFSGTGWSGSDTKRTWTGNASSVSFSGDIIGKVTSPGGNINIVFTIEPATVAVTGVTLAPTSATLTLGETETVTLIPTVLPGDATDKSVTWSSSNEAVATVTDGVVTAVAAGTATITVTTTDGAKTATCAVTVAAPAASTYTVTLKEGTEDATSWTIAPAEATTTGVAAGTTVTASYGGVKKVKSVKAKKKASAEPAGNIVDLSGLTGDYEAQDGDVLSGSTSYSVTIADNATVTLNGVTMNGDKFCIGCAGSATIILKDGTTNTLTSTSQDYPALSIGDANTTLTIQGNTGVLNVTSGKYCAGIGGGYKNTNSTCGNIRIEGGVITAQGGYSGSGIGSDCGRATCGDIIITGGTITAKGGNNAAGIGTGNGEGSSVVCGDITIANTVTKVTATAGEYAPYSIGKGFGVNATCGTITIGGTGYGTDGVSDSPYIYQPSN